MKTMKESVKGFILGVLISLAVVAITGAVNEQTVNNGGDTDHPFENVYASNDGKTVFVCDANTVYRSTDGGANWTVILRKKPSGTD
jgi:photosystem II stability/assembly factor-like uncharacterized protein